MKVTKRVQYLGPVVILALAACGAPQPITDASAQPTRGGPSEPIGDPPPSAVADPGADCAAPEAEPGPADDPPRAGGDLIDVSDQGGGRWRLCLAGPIVASVENSAWCRWSPDRRSVLEVSGLQIRLGAIGYDAWFALSRAEFQLSTTDFGRGGLIATYVPANEPIGEASEDGVVGQLSFDVALQIDPEAGAPAGALPRHVGAMRWVCGDPPPAG